MDTRRSSPPLAAMLGLFLVCTCDDAARTTSVGGLVVVVRTVASTSQRFGEIVEVVIEYDRVEAIHRAAGATAERAITVDTARRRLLLRNADEETVVAQYPVPVGTVTQLRFFPVSVTLKLASGASVTLDPDSSDLPSWRNSGWKFTGATLPIRLDELTGLRATLDFETRFVRPGQSGWKMKPTLPAEPFEVNPPAGQPGVFHDRLTVVFREGTLPSRVDEINARIRASTIFTPTLGTWYRVKLPATINSIDAVQFYLEQPEVLGALPAVNFGQFFQPADNPNRLQTDLIDLPAAWDIALDGGGIGRETVTGALIDGTAIEVGESDLYRNVWINQGELPTALFDTNGSGKIDRSELDRFDVNGDGLITIRDLEVEDAGIRPRDANGNGRVDGFDLLYDIRWANGINEDRNGISPKRPAGLVDDLIGWDFADDDKDPTLSKPLPDGGATPLRSADGGILFGDLGLQHGTDVASVMMAEGNNGAGMSGVIWRTSVIVVRAGLTILPSDGGPTETTVPQEAFSEAVRYVDSMGARVVNVSMGWSFARKGYGAVCALNEKQTTAGVKSFEIWDAGVRQAETVYAALFKPTKALWVLAAGNSGHFLEDRNVLTVPQGPVFDAIPERTLLVGNTADGVSNFVDLANPSARSASSFGAPVQLWAPGCWTVPGAGFGCGTSLSAPVVAGSALLLASHNSSFAGVGGASALKRALVTTAQPSVTVSCGTFRMFSQPLLNPRALLGATP